MRSTFLGLSAIAVFLVVGWAAGAEAQTFPADGDWRVLMCGGVPSFDPLADEPSATNERDIVGDTNAPALYFFADGTHLFFRMRVDADPSSGSGFRPFGWAVEFDTDGDRRTYEILAQVDGISSPDVVGLHRNTMQRTLDDPADPVEETITTFDITTHARSVLAEGMYASSFDGTPDFFVDFALDRDVLTAEGVVGDTTLVLVVGTSSNTQAINADLACNVGGVDPATLTATGTDPLTPSGAPVPDSDGDTIPDVEEAVFMTDPNLADTDGDGFDDGIEIREGTDPTDPNSFPMTTVPPDPDMGVRGGGGVAGGCAVLGAPAPGSGGALFGVFLLSLYALCRRTRVRSSRGNPRPASKR